MKRCRVSTILLGAFWLSAVLFWWVTFVLWLLWEFGFVEKNEVVLGVFVFGDCLAIVSCVELAILMLALIVYFAIHEEDAKKKWEKIAAIVVGFTYLPLIPFYGLQLLMLITAIHSG